MNSRERILVFDVNETLLDISVLDPFFEDAFHDVYARREWFINTLLNSQSLTLSGQFASFDEIGLAALQMLGQARNVRLSQAQIDNFTVTKSRLPSHPEVCEALEALQSSGFRVVTLSNSGQAPSENALKSAKIDRYFQRLFSVEQIRRYKPAFGTYEAVLGNLNVSPERLRLIAAHPWDTFGAMAAGLASTDRANRKRRIPAWQTT